MQTLMIQDLAGQHRTRSQGHDGLARRQDNQAIGSSQANVQSMVAAANVGNGSKFCGPTNIQSDNTFSQDAY